MPLIAKKFFYIIINFQMRKIITNSVLYRFSQLNKQGLSARKYIRSITETALLYKPELVGLDQKSNITDRVVQTFFDSSTSRIQVFQAIKRLTDVSQFSSPAHSFYQVTLPFKDNQQLRKKMIQFFDNHIRVGRVLELMDYIAANVAYRYCSSEKELDDSLESLSFYTVTASIDEIDFFHPIDARIDCTFSGYVSYVGSSSMEVQIDVMQKIGAQLEDRLACSAKFVMVARDKATGKAYKVPPLNLEDMEKFKYKSEMGKKRQETRKIESKNNLNISPPTYEQSSKVHNLMLRVNKQPNILWIPMKSTIQRNTLLMHLQDKNLSGKIFGGFILRLAYELGWLAGFKFLKGIYPRCTHIDDVQFLGPVEIGTSVELQAVISYMTPQIMHVIVECHNVKGDGTSRLTNILRISFEYKDPNNKTQERIVFPESIKQSMQYIESMRRVNKYLTQ